MMASTQEPEIYDVIIVGAGPCGLATAARLRERTPAALFTDEEHRRYHWIGKHGSKVSLKHVTSGKTRTGKAKRGQEEYKMLVLDSTDDRWLGRWKTLFSKFDISHLRSPMLWHVDPLDRDSLLAHAYTNEREDELVEIRNCVGKEMSKHERKKRMCGSQRACGGKQAARVAINIRERNDYYTPSQALFCDHCQDVASRYRLDSDLIRKETLQDLDYGVVRGVSTGDEQLFTVQTPGSSRYARTVVLAVGPANVPNVPRLPSMKMHGPELPQACHSMRIGQFPDVVVQRKIDRSQPSNILVVGGGLTSAQLSDLAIRRGVSKVWHVMRGPLRIKHFDVDLSWMGKYKNAEQARFWTADSDAERLGIIKTARGGGSITPLFHKRLRKHVSSGRLELRVETAVVDARFEQDDETKPGQWIVTTEPPAAEMPPFDYIYFATGIQTDFSSLPYLQTMLEKHPVPGMGGFPCVNEDLMWKDGIPLFTAGRLGSLQLGPAAGNVGGAKLGAERIAWAIEDLVPLPTDKSVEDNDGGGDDDDNGRSPLGGGMAEYLSGHGNMFASLQCDV